MKNITQHNTLHFNRHSYHCTVAVVVTAIIINRIILILSTETTEATASRANANQPNDINF